MDLNSTTDHPINLTAEIPPMIPASRIFSLVIFLITFLFGLFVNNLYLWVLKFRMKKSVNTTLFFHLILANLFFIVTIPFVALYFLWEPHWIFGTFLCKVINSSLTLSMYVAVFILTLISLDRYVLVFHPHWYRSRIHHGHASFLCLLVWGFAILCSSPYLAFRRLRQENTTTICYNDYTMDGTWENKKIQVKWGMFIFRLLLGFILPFIFITGCYIQIMLKMKIEHLARSSKPYKIIFTAVISFFICWLPYHVLYGMSIVENKFQQNTLSALKVLTVCLSCINCCLTPILYLFIVESFKKVFRKSILALIESAFNETFISMDRSFEEKPEMTSSHIIKYKNQEHKKENRSFNDNTI